MWSTQKSLMLVHNKIPWRRKWQPTPVFLPGKSKDRGAWRAIVDEVARVGHDLGTKPPPPTWEWLLEFHLCSPWIYPLQISQINHRQHCVLPSSILKVQANIWLLWASKLKLREGNGTPLQYSCLENPMDGGAWWAAVCRVAQSRTRLKWLSSSKLKLTNYPRWSNNSTDSSEIVINMALWASQVALGVKSPLASAGDITDMGLIPGSGRSPGRGHVNPFQCFCLGNPMNRGTRWAIVRRFAKSQTQLKLLSTHTHGLYTQVSHWLASCS